MIEPVDLHDDHAEYLLRVNNGEAAASSSLPSPTSLEETSSPAAPDSKGSKLVIRPTTAPKLSESPKGEMGGCGVWSNHEDPGEVGFSPGYAGPDDVPDPNELGLVVSDEEEQKASSKAEGLKQQTL